MKRHQLILFLICAALIEGCKKDDAEKWKVTLAANDSRPYGAKLARQSLADIFPGIPIHDVPEKIRYTNIQKKLKNAPDSGNLMILAGLDFYLSSEEWTSLYSFVSMGNEVILFSTKPDSRIEEWCQWEKQRGQEEMKQYVAELQQRNQRRLRLPGDTTLYGYTGRYIKGTFYSEAREQPVTDTVSDEPPQLLIATDTLGYCDSSVNFIRFNVGRGHISLHAAPLVLSNYFLLQGNNRHYLEGVWSTLPRNITHVYWHSYYKRLPVYNSKRPLWRLPTMRAAMLLALLTALLYILFQSKRRQRAIAVIPPLKNDSVTFVETIGRLYFNRRDHRNLALKMSHQFLDWVRNTYYINTAHLDGRFIQQLAHKSGMSEEATGMLVQMLNQIRNETIQPDDAYMYQLYSSIQDFYKLEQ